MKNHSVKRGGAIAFAITFILALAMPLMAQEPKQYNNAVLTGYVMNQGSTSNLFGPLYIDASRSQVISFAASCSVSAGDATNAAFFLAPSVDGIGMDTNHPVVIFCAPQIITQTNFNWYVTNVTAGGLQGYFLYQITNGTQLSTVTNSLKYSVKISSP